MAKQFDPTKTDDIQYNVNIPGFHTSKRADDDIMSVKCWLECVECGLFIDYDGYGDGIKVDGTFVERVRPSMVPNIDPEIEWVVWYNR